MPTAVTPFRSEVDNIVSGLDYFEIVLDYPANIIAVGDWVHTPDILHIGQPGSSGTYQIPAAHEADAKYVAPCIVSISYVAIGQAEGAELALGGARHGDRGYFHQPTVFTSVRNDMRIAQEEIFGPVMSVLKFSSEEEAYRIANDTEYGLAGSVFTADTDRGYGVAARVRSGTFGVNEGYIMDPAAPFGGVKNSGYGRELGVEGIDSYTVSQSISAAAQAN